MEHPASHVESHWRTQLRNLSLIHISEPTRH